MDDKKATEPAETEGENAVPAKPQLTGWRKFMLDFGPLLVFFGAFRFGEGNQAIFSATIAFMVAIVLAAVYSKLKQGHISAMHKFTFVVVMVMGGLTLYLQDETFVKMKLTLINGVIAAILLFGLMTGRLYIKTVMEMALELPDEAWRLLTRNYTVFLLVMAAVNEAIWRTQSTEFWVNFKTFGYMAINFVFIMAHMPMLMKHMPEEDDKSPG